MLSRFADCLYWMGRYLERVDDTARLIEINVLHLLEADDAVPADAHWRPLLGISGSVASYAAAYADGEVRGPRVIRFMTQERSNPNSIRQSLRLARDNARVVRDRISKEMWEIINELWLRAEPHLSGTDAPESMVPFCRFIRSQVARFHGVTGSTMMRGEAFGFHQLGTFVERADMTARILDVKYHLLLPELSLVGSALDYYQWAALLKSLSGFEAYRRLHHTGFSPAEVAEFVVLEPDFPRSLRFSVERIGEALEWVDGGRAMAPTTRIVGSLLSELAATRRGTLFERGLHDFLDDFIARIAALNRALHEVYFQATGDARCAT